MKDIQNKVEDLTSYIITNLFLLEDRLGINCSMKNNKGDDLFIYLYVDGGEMYILNKKPKHIKTVIDLFNNINTIITEAEERGYKHV